MPSKTPSNAIMPSKPPTNSLMSSLLSAPPVPKSLTTKDILNLVQRLSSTHLPTEAKKSGLTQLVQVPSITESLVHQLVTVEPGDLLSGVKCVLTEYLDTGKENAAEVLQMTLEFLNRCL